MKLANELRRLRLEKQLSVEDAAKLIGISKQYVNYIEKGQRVHISFTIMVKIAEGYGVSLDYLAQFTE
ncbi:helix-turn-helix domain-containing protein [Ammoniphilus sp. YIM 78166]|uniref:helix-turn-helix domain-containing protein n=1 Tax=Ammoniphilus sp. YIM 78166 TaxID=1644106 RepID=UPI001070287C|nr:helix-turn-helix transcriptional regulator [Ammoniphilus sp. YIM 78166]